MNTDALFRLFVDENEKLLIAWRGVVAALLLEQP
jgi:hypothetical protein